MIFANTLLHPASVRNCPGSELGIFCISIVDIILRSVLVVFGLLRASNYHYNSGPICYVLPFYSTVSYQYCSYLYHREIHLCRYIHWYCPLTYKVYIIPIMFYLKMSQIFAFLTNIKSVHLQYFRNTTFFWQTKKSINFDFLIIYSKCRNQVPFTKTKQPMKHGSLSAVGRFL